MIAIKGMEIPTDCKKCPLAGTDGIDKFSPMMCVAIWATKREIKHCVEGKILDDCPLVDIVTCEECEYWHDDGIMTTCDKNIGHGFPRDHFCPDGKRKECRDTEEGFVNGLPRSDEYFEERKTGNPDFCNG